MNALLRLALLLLIAGPACAQSLVDDFSDGDFSTAPIWQGNAENFTVNGDQQLQLLDDQAAQSVLYSTYASADLSVVEWRVWVKQSFSPSANNHSRIYLSAQEPLSVPTGIEGVGAQGYFLLLGEAGSADAISLYRDDTAGVNAALLATGTPGLVSSSFEIGLRITLDAAGNWEIWADQNGGTDYSLEASASDATYTTSTVTGVACTYTASNADNFYFDNWFFGPLVVDETAPLATNAVVLDAQSVELTFNEALDQTAAENTANYLLNGTNAPSAATLTTTTQVTLTFASAFTSGVEQTLAVAGIEDAAGNASASQDLFFTWTAPVQPSYRQVLINEIMADPDPAVGLPVVEYLELFNNSTETFDLQDWVLVNTNTAKTLDSHVLEAGGHVILCDTDDATALGPYGNVLGIASFTALANTADSLTLIDAWGEVVDIVVYTNDWYQSDELSDGGHSLEQINPDLLCTMGGNWRASTSLSGGTPGSVNSVLDLTPDTTAPEVLEAHPTGGMTAEATLSEPLTAQNWENVVVTVVPDLVVVSFLGNGNTLSIEVDMPFDIGPTYTVQIASAVDCSGNDGGLLEASFELGYTPVPGDLRITEIMADPDQELPSPNAEFVEIENRSALQLDLSNVALEGAGFSSQVLLGAGGRLILCSSEELDSFTAWPDAVGLADFPGLTNSGRELTLDIDGVVLDHVAYTNDWYGDTGKDDGGYSLELINPLDPCSDASNWFACQHESGATPGAQNSIHDLTPDTDAAEVSWLLVNSPTQMGLLLNEQVDVASLEANCTELATGNPASFTATTVSVHPEFAHVVLIDLDQAIPAGTRYQLHLSGLQDCWANVTDDAVFSFSLPEPTLAGDLLINEVLSNPFTGGADFVELINASAHAVDLFGMSVGELDAGAVASLKPITDHHIVLEPGDIVAISADARAQATSYPFARFDRIIEVPSLPGYNNSEGSVVVTDALDQVLDQMTYSDDQHYALLDNLDGVSLERISFTRASDDLSNWHSAAESHGYATPGYANSQSQLAGSGSGEFWLDLPVFSPDNDGFQDVVQVSYTLDQPGWVATVRVFDHQGREMRLLQHNTLLGTSGTFSWDGQRDDRQKARMGMYIIWIERFTADGQTAADKLTVAVAHQLN